MRHYYFDVENDRTFFPDEQGLTLRDIDAANDAALAILADVVKQGPANGTSQTVEVLVREHDEPYLLEASVTLAVTRKLEPVRAASAVRRAK